MSNAILRLALANLALLLAAGQTSAALTSDSVGLAYARVAARFAPATASAAAWHPSEVRRVRVDIATRLGVTPLVGTVGGHMGAGLDLSLGYGKLALGVRHTEGSELCDLCADTESEAQTSFLAGVRREFAFGSATLRTGLGRVERVTDDAGDLRVFRGFSVPVQLDLYVGGRFAGANLSFTGMIDRDGGSTGIVVGVPVGYLRR